MKRITRFVIVIILLVISLILIISNSNYSYGYTAKDKNGITWYYTVSGNSAYNVYIYSGTVSGDTLEIPETLGGYNVAGLRGYNVSAAASSTYRRNILGNSVANNTTIKKIIIPNTVTNIGNNTFCKFTALEEVIIPDSVTSIGSYAFYLCNNLKSIEVNADFIGNDAFNACNSLKNVIIGDNVTTISARAFYYSPSIETIEFGNSVTTIGDSAFVSSKAKSIVLPDSVTSIGNANFGQVEEITIGSGLTTIPTSLQADNSNLKRITVSENNSAYCSIDGILFSKDKTMLIMCPQKKELPGYNIPNTVTTINSYAFYRCKSIVGNLTIPNSVITIGDYAFENCNGLTGNLVIPNSVKTIGNYAFYKCSNFYGDLSIPSNVTSIGTCSFGYCNGFDGILTIENGLTTIPMSAFSNNEKTNFKKVFIGNSVTSIEYNAFLGFSDIWINNKSENVSLDTNFGSYNEIPTYVHWQGCTHEVVIDTMPGVKLVNIETNEVLTSGNYSCETEFSYKIEIDDNYNYSSLKLIEINDKDRINFKKNVVNTSDVYNFNYLIRSRELYAHEIVEQLDLTMRMFITEINGQKISESREPRVNLNEGSFEYCHTKYPISVNTDDLITCILRIYNEGAKSGYVQKVSAYIPEGLELDVNNSVNKSFNWTVEENSKISTTYLKNTIIDEYTGNGTCNYKDLRVVFKVKKEKQNDVKSRLNIIAEIEAQSESDYDSSCNISSPVPADYKEAESYASNSNSYIAGQEDDDDFENVVLLGNSKVEYNIKITSDILSGAKFKLLNEAKEEIKQEYVNEEGILDFGTFESYGDGKDIYYAEEIEVPESINLVTRNTKIKIIVTKILNETDGTYITNIGYEVEDYEVNIESYDYIPIYSAEQLQKIGSGEVVNINGTDYTLSADSNYKLMNDIDLNGIQWKTTGPMNGVINGNNCKISNFYITSSSQVYISEIGMFSVFTGIIKDLELENFVMSIPGFYATGTTNYSGYTGAGAFAGVMSDGIIDNCKVSGGIYCQMNNVGGFIGHTLPGNTVKIKDCTNSATVVTTNSYNNCGGIVGCALGGLNIINATNTGNITSTNYNAGGIIGYVDTQQLSLAEFKNCKNYGQITSSYINSGGIVGNSHFCVKIDDCINYGNIHSQGRAGGIIAELNEDSINDISTINNCSNYGEIIVSGSSQGAAAGIVAHGIGYVIVNKCTNEGIVTASGSMGAGGITGEATGVIVITDCRNIAEISSNLTGTVNANVGGILGKVRPNTYIAASLTLDKTTVVIKNCKNIGILKSGTHTGGIVGFAQTQSIEISKCEVSDCSIIDYYTGERGGIIGFIDSKNINIQNCNVTNTEIYRNSGVKATYGKTGGIIGNIYATSSIETLKVINCNVTNCKISSTQGETGGIIGGECLGYSELQEHIIYGCKVENCNIENNEIAKNTIYGNSGGIIGYTERSSKLSISNCLVNNSSVSAILAEGETKPSCMGVGGIVGDAVSIDYFNIDNCFVVNSTVTGETLGDYYGNVSGIVGFSMSTENINLTNCNVMNTKITAIDGNIGGIYGVSLGESIKINNCHVGEESIITKNLTYPVSNQSMGGLIGFSDDETMEILNSSVSNIKIKGSTTVAGGLVGGTYSNLIIDNSKVYNIEIAKEKFDNNVEYSAMGGVVGLCNNAASITNIEIKNSYIHNEEEFGSVAGIVGSAPSDNIVIKNSKVNGCKIESNVQRDKSYNKKPVAAVAGAVYNITLENVNVGNNTTITTIDGASAGAVAVVGDIKAKNCNISDVKIQNKGYIADISNTSDQCLNNMAGFVGIVWSKAELSGINIKNVEIIGPAENSGGIYSYSYDIGKLEDCTVDNLTLNVIDIVREFNYAVGGIGGTTEVVSGPISNNIVKNSTINTKSHIAAGLFGCLLSEASLDNCNLINTTINNNNELSNKDNNNSDVNSLVGGLVGISNKNITINNSTVKDSNLELKEGIATTGHLGGIIGFAIDEVILENNKVINTNIINNTSEGVTGGIASMTNKYISEDDGEIEKTLTINNSSIDNCNNIVGKYHVGGILGFGKLISNENNTISDTNVTGESGTDSYGDVGGAIGNALDESDIKNISVTNIKR